MALPLWTYDGATVVCSALVVSVVTGAALCKVPVVNVVETTVAVKTAWSVVDMVVATACKPNSTPNKTPPSAPLLEDVVLGAAKVEQREDEEPNTDG